jgi:spore maturation protein SpmB
MGKLAPVIGLYAASVAYSVVRYVAFAPKNAENIPVFITNKGLSMAAALCFAIGLWTQMRPGRGDGGLWFRAGVWGVAAHVPMSLAILSPAYFKEFYTDPALAGAAGPRLSFAGEMVFLFGGLALATMLLQLRATVGARTRWVLSLAMMSVLLVHVLSMGASRGLNINVSHAYLPPMWLLSALGVLAGLVFVLLTRPPAAEPGGQR